MRIAFFSVTAMSASALLMSSTALAQASCRQAVHHQADSDFAARQRIHAAMPRLLEHYQVPGAAVALVQNGVPDWSHGYGLAIPAQGIPVDPSNTRFQAASISKSVTAVAVLTLW